MRALLVAFALVVPGIATAAPARVGVLVMGEYLKGPSGEQVEKWLRDHSREAVSTPLPAEAIKTLENCFVLDDGKCARAIVDARSTADSTIVLRVEVTSKKDREVRLTIDWFVKGHSPVSSRRTCEACTENVLRSTIDTILIELAKSNPGFMGRVKVVSDPPGIPVLLDKETIGVTPIERDVPAGAHIARLVKDGRMGAEQTVKVEPGATVDVKLLPPAPGHTDQPPPPPPGRRPSRIVPAVIITIGLVGGGVGAGMYVIGGPTGNAMTYNDLRTPGIYTMIGGGVVAVTGLIWILATGSSSGPTVAMTPTGGATIGWSGRF